MAGMGKRGSDPGPGRQPGPWLVRCWRLMHQGGSGGWLILTIVQALLTWAFLALAGWAKGLPFHRLVELLVVGAIVATWCLALRTIRARLLELVRSWRRHLIRCAESARRTVQQADQANHEGLAGDLHYRRSLEEQYYQHSIQHLRLIAAGITVPFFILPAFCSAASISLCWFGAPHSADLLGLAFVLSMLAAMVGTYFRWSIVPELAPLPVQVLRRRGRGRVWGSRH